VIAVTLSAVCVLVVMVVIAVLIASGDDTEPTAIGAAPGTVVDHACAASGPDEIAVPNVVGTKLADAIEIVNAAGLNVIDMGVPDGDPTGPNTRVIAQEPPPDIKVPRGACIGFRTTSQ
jgi:hypothetical protein